MNEKRLSQLRQMMADDPSDPFFPYAIAQEYVSAGKHAEASEILEGMIERFPDYVPAYQHCGMAMLENGRPESALMILKRGMEKARAAGDRKAFGEMQMIVEDLTD